MATQTLSPGTMANNTAVGADAWSDVNNAKTSDNSYASVTTFGFGNTSNYLQASNFGFTIPTSATVQGITVSIENRSGDDTATDSAVRIVKADGSIGSTNKASGTTWTHPTPDNVFTYGGSSDLWGETWTPAQINDADFGVVLSTNINPFSTNQVDHIQITVTYVVPPFKSICGVPYASVKSINGIPIAQIKSVGF